MLYLCVHLFETIRAGSTEHLFLTGITNKISFGKRITIIQFYINISARLHHGWEMIYVFGFVCECEIACMQSLLHRSGSFHHRIEAKSNLPKHANKIAETNAPIWEKKRWKKGVEVYVCMHRNAVLPACVCTCTFADTHTAITCFFDLLWKSSGLSVIIDLLWLAPTAVFFLSLCSFRKHIGMGASVLGACNFCLQKFAAMARPDMKACWPHIIYSNLIAVCCFCCSSIVSFGTKLYQIFLFDDFSLKGLSHLRSHITKFRFRKT